MKITAPADQINGRISATKVRNRGITPQRNGGIGFGNWYWEYNELWIFSASESRVRKLSFSQLIAGGSIIS